MNNSIEYSLMEMYLEKLYQSETITLAEMDEIRNQMAVSLKNVA